MNNDVQLFTAPEFGTIRTLIAEGVVLFCGKDVATALGYVNPAKAIRDHCKGGPKRYPLETQGGIQQTRFITEPDLYRLIINSKLPAAQKFEAWIFEEVLPAIRKHGGYIRPDATEHQVNALIAQARMRMELCQAARGLIHPDHLEAKARVILAQGMGEHATLDPARAPLYTQDFLKSKNLSKTQLRKIAGTFGKRVKAAYVLEHGTEPGKYPLSLPNGQTRDCYAYTEADRALMQNVWDTHYTN